MRYYELTESRSKDITNEQASELIKANCSNSINSTPIWRGIYNERRSYMFFDGTKNNIRKAANTTNYMNLFVSNNEAWSEYPKRSKSLICATAQNIAEGYGQVYRVFPYDNIKIGVCPEDDFWLSITFDNTSNDVFEYTRHISELYEYMSKVYLNEYEKLSETNYNKFITQLGNIDKFIKTLKKDEWKQIIPEKFLWMFNKNGEVLGNLFNTATPKKQGFKLVSAGTELPKKNEVWLSGPAILVNEHSLAQGWTKLD